MTYPPTIRSNLDGDKHHFEIYKRPYLWGLFGKRKWIKIIITPCQNFGLSYCKWKLGMMA